MKTFTIKIDEKLEKTFEELTKNIKKTKIQLRSCPILSIFQCKVENS